MIEVWCQDIFMIATKVFQAGYVYDEDLTHIKVTAFSISYWMHFEISLSQKLSKGAHLHCKINLQLLLIIVVTTMVNILQNKSQFHRLHFR